MGTWARSRGHATAVTSRVASHAAFAAELGARRRKLGTAVVAETTRTGATTAAAAAAHVVPGTGTCFAASRHGHCARRAVAVAGAVAAAAAVGLARRRSVGTVTGWRHDSSFANVASAGVLRRAAVITTSSTQRKINTTWPAAALSVHASYHISTDSSNSIRDCCYIFPQRTHSQTATPVKQRSLLVICFSC